LIVQAIRSALFYLLFIGQTAVIAISIGTIALFSRGERTPLTWAMAKYWCRSNLWLLRFIAGIRTTVEGEENIPEGGCIIASKHQSDWDVFAVFPHTGRPAYIVKKELMDIPFFGNAARSLDCIEVDRKKGADAMTSMIEGARAAIAKGCRIVIFPEGTRKAPLAEPDYKWGVARLYEALNVPVVPVALNSGLFWGRNSLILWPGRPTAKLLPPIPPGLPMKEFQARLISAIEGESDALAVKADNAGIKRPLTPAQRARLDLLQTNQATH
jgi:1-acyl-sn-glycerol-3-phosphate acyltransferase